MNSASDHADPSLATAPALTPDSRRNPLAPNAWRGWLHALICVAVAAALRWGGMAESLWVDELHTAWAAVGSADDVLRRSALGNQSPLFGWLVWAAVRTFGPHEWAFRGISFVCGLGLVLAVHQLVVRATRRLVWANVAALLLAVDSHCIFYSVEARPYAAVQLVGLAHFVLFMRFLRQDGDGRVVSVLHVATGWLLFWLHYTAGLVFLAEALALPVFVITVRDGRRRWWPGCRQLALLALGCAPALPHLWAISQRGSAWSPFGAAGPWWRMLEVLHGGWYALAPLLLYTLDSAYRQLTLLPSDDAPAPVPRRRWLLAYWWLVPVIAAWSVARAQWVPVFLGRYLTVSTAAPVLLGTMLGGGMRSRKLRGLAIVLLAAGAVYANQLTRLVQFGLAPPPKYEDWRGVVNQLNELRGEKQQRYPILVRAGLIEADLEDWRGEERDEFLTYPLRSAYVLETPAELVPLGNSSDFTMAEDLRRRIDEAGGVWLVVRGPPSRAEAYARRVQELLGDTWRATQHTQQGRVQLVQLEPAGPG